MSGGSTFTSDQKALTATTTTTTIMRGGRSRITSVQAEGIANGTVAFYDANVTASITAGNKKLEYSFGTEGLQMYFPGSGVLFKDGIGAAVTNTTSTTITYTGG
tara:strand:+ start:650 stop:961 length:312 start_codon:yes stop_codon:yes gene_type:complete